MKDTVKVRDSLSLQSGGQHRFSGPTEDKEPVQITGFFSAVCRERGKLVPGTRREGKNIWTLTGREYLARLMSYSAYGSTDTPARNDRIRYIGFGIGTTPEVASVSKLDSPIAYDVTSSVFLAELAIPTYPFQTTGSYGTSVRYTREFAEGELSVTTTVTLTEAGLFTDGALSSLFVPPRSISEKSIGEATNQAPVAYKTFDPLKKTNNFVLQISWEVRF